MRGPLAYHVCVMMFAPMHLDAFMWPHHFLIMRTTLTLGDTLVTALKKKAAEKGVPFKSIVNQALRFGLETMDESDDSPAPYQTRTRRLGLRTRLSPPIPQAEAT